MFGLTPLPLYAIAFLLATNLATGLGLKWSMSNTEAEKQKVVECRAKHAVFVEQTNAIGEIAKEKARLEKLENERIANDTAKGWAAALGAVRASKSDLDKRMRDSAARRGSGGGGLSAPAQDRPGDAGTGTDSIPSPARVAQDCAETTITLNYLQSYIERIQDE